MSKDKLPYFLISLALILVFSAGSYMYGKGQSPAQVIMTTNPPSPTQTASKNTVLPNSFIKQASFQGQVTKLESDKATVMNTDNQTQLFTVSKNVIITRSTTPSAGTTVANTKLNTIPLNQSGIFTIVLVNDEYQITSATILAATPARVNPQK